MTRWKEKFRTRTVCIFQATRTDNVDEFRDAARQGKGQSGRLSLPLPPPFKTEIHITISIFFEDLKYRQRWL